MPSQGIVSSNLNTPTQSLADFSPKIQANAYRRVVLLDQQVISHGPVPEPIAAAYALCEPAPALNDMNPFRDDGKASLKFFTDPEYFFRLWCEDMQQQTEKEQMKRRKKKVSALLTVCARARVCVCVCVCVSIVACVCVCMGSCAM